MVSRLTENEPDIEENLDVGSYPLIQTGLGILQASSEWDPSHGVSRGILHYNITRVGCQGWAAAHNDLKQWIQLSAQKVVRWKSILTQGRGNLNQWVTRFKIQYNKNGQEWRNYHDSQIFQANSDQDTVVVNNLDVPLVAQAIRILPLNWNNHITMRIEAIVSDNVRKEEYEPNSLVWVPAIDIGLPVATSSEYDPHHGPSRIRLNFNIHREGSLCWSAAILDQNQWVQVSSAKPRKWVKIDTQGRGDHYEQWITEYYISYSLDGNTWFQAEEGIFYRGNTDMQSVVSHVFERPFVARVVRIHPVSWHGHISCRLELYYENKKRD